MPSSPHETPSMWVFGYGSLIWKPGFTYTEKIIGFIEGYARRFWQGSISHRGTSEYPGRVATLVKENESKVWGLAYLLVGDDQIAEAMDHLDLRECTLGGYTTFTETFYQKDKEDTVSVWIYSATPDNHLYTGPETVEQVAHQVSKARGFCGHNAEYVLKIANFMQQHLPNVEEDDLYTLEKLILKNLEQMGFTVYLKDHVFSLIENNPDLEYGENMALHNGSLQAEKTSNLKPVPPLQHGRKVRVYGTPECEPENHLFDNASDDETCLICNCSRMQSAS
ncbi:glutathione-specific gamma-glutamylcyclotransferase 1 [Lingula anatina]|uniref:glutathione-specific gamma-glutamylcyclotransferase n=1 Tax=Lingula anatina TaxID=7574 RepID=A0A1S3HVA4_LINAN|nr:glutathione-specific gamma-glutamylcyclotransferase 1 [Lingula anatina]|eukprot:XP_013388984.1 glutathione-specific gamma-glutamylcyclotransferase 1 [Lingula anatina]